MLITIYDNNAHKKGALLLPKGLLLIMLNFDMYNFLRITLTKLGLFLVFVSQ